MAESAGLPLDLADDSGRISEAWADLSVDQQDFNTYCWKNRRPFENLIVPDR